MKQKGMNALAPPEPFKNPYLQNADIVGSVASMVTPGAILNKLKPAATFLGNVGQATGVGAATGLVNPNAKDLGANAEDAAWGAALGAAIPAVSIPVAKAAGWLWDAATGKLVQMRAGKIIREIAGPDTKALVAAGNAANPNLTGAQAAADIHNTQMQALGELASGRNTGSFFSKKADIAKQDAQAVLDSLAGGATQAEANLARKGNNVALNTITTPMREAELGAANLGTPTIDTSAITTNIQSKLADPSIGVSDVNKRVLNAVGKKIEEWTAANGGVIDAQALYEIRKNTVNEVVQRLIGKTDPTAQAKYASKILSEVNPLIDNAIIKAGGTGWKDYLATHASGLKDIERQKMASVLSELHRNGSYDKFQNIVNGNDTKAVENIFGKGNVDIKSLMGDKMVPLQKIADDLTRSGGMLTQAKQGATGLTDILSKDATKLRLPALFSRAATVSNKALDILEAKINRATFMQLEKSMQSGKSMADLISTLPTSERNAVLKALADPKTARQLALITNQNALAPQSKNALAP